MVRELDIVVPSHKKRERIDRFLAHQIEHASRSKVQKAIASGLVLVDGRKVKPSYEISPGERIHVTLPAPEPPRLEPEPIPLDIVYEDDALIIVNKAAGMVVHPAYGNYTGTLVHALLYHCKDIARVNDETRPGLVHRLDKNTSGLLVVAKTEEAHRFLSSQFSQRTVDREYWALVWGTFTSRSGTIEAELGRHKSDRKKFAVVSSGKPAVTEYEVLEAFSFLSLVRLHLRTGRTHQIRVHLHHIGHPVFGDPTYGGRRIASGGGDGKRKRMVQSLLPLIERQALHAKTLGFVHPVKHTFVKFDSDLPGDMQALLDSVRDMEAS
ncbi:MAG TPA: RluA family pseudouridine synthase [Bacteroidota bacterium]